jgi:two-component system, probable response regulator PhcQ
MSYKVLLVDDEPNVLFALKRSLRKEKFNISTAESGQKALDILEQEDIDVVISDQDMPGMTGTKFLACVKEKYPETVRFILTGKATLEVAVDAINEGAISRFFMKPCNISDLVITIRQSLQHKELIAKAMKLLQKVKTQEEVIKTVEKSYPGISDVKRDIEGRITLPDTPVDYESFIKKINESLGE